jgi:hypothetical protein
LFANRGEGLGEKRGAGEQEGERKPAKEHEPRLAKYEASGENREFGRGGSLRLTSLGCVLVLFRA